MKDSHFLAGLRKKFSITPEMTTREKSHYPEYGYFLQTYNPFIQQMKRCLENEILLRHLNFILAVDRYPQLVQGQIRAEIEAILKRCIPVVPKCYYMHDGCDEQIDIFREFLKGCNCYCV